MGEDLDVALRVEPLEVCEGEPVYLRYEIRNSCHEELLVYLGRNRISWFDIFLTNQRGQIIAAVQDPRIDRTAFGDDVVRMSSGRSVSGEFGINQLFHLNEPGRYIVTIEVNLPYASRRHSATLFRSVTSALRENPVRTILQRLKLSEANSLPLLTKRHTFNLTVEPRDDAKLRRLATDLKHPSHRCDFQDDLAPLFSLPEDIGLDQWRTIIHSDELSPREFVRVAEHIARVPSAQTVDLLIEMAWDLAVSTGSQYEVQDILRNLHLTVGPNERRRIEAAFSAKGIPLPDVHGPVLAAD